MRGSCSHVGHALLPRAGGFSAAYDWAEYLVGPEIERRLNAARLRTYNRPADCWAADDGEGVGSAGG